MAAATEMELHQELYLPVGDMKSSPEFSLDVGTVDIINFI